MESAVLRDTVDYTNIVTAEEDLMVALPEKQEELTAAKKKLGARPNPTPPAAIALRARPARLVRVRRSGPYPLPMPACAATAAHAVR